MKLLNWYESKPECNGQTIEQFLHYPIGLVCFIVCYTLYSSKSRYNHTQRPCLTIASNVVKRFGITLARERLSEKRKPFVVSPCGFSEAFLRAEGSRLCSCSISDNSQSAGARILSVKVTLTKNRTFNHDVACVQPSVAFHL